jgi:hypothetical protein
MTLYIVEWHEQDPPYAGGIAGVFDSREAARELVARFTHNHAHITEWPLNFGDLPKAEKDEQGGRLQLTPAERDAITAAEIALRGLGWPMATEDAAVLRSLRIRTAD